MRDYDKEIEELQKLQRIKIIAETKKRCLLKLENLLGRGEILITYNEGKRPIKIGSYRTSRIERSTFKTSAWTTKTVEGMVFETHPIYNENEYHLEIETTVCRLNGSLKEERDKLEADREGIYVPLIRKICYRQIVKMPETSVEHFNFIFQTEGMKEYLTLEKMDRMLKTNDPDHQKEMIEGSLGPKEIYLINKALMFPFGTERFEGQMKEEKNIEEREEKIRKLERFREETEKEIRNLKK